MKKLCCFFIFLLLCLGACGGFNAPIEVGMTHTVIESSSVFPLYWQRPYGGVCAHRNSMLDRYSLIEIEGSDLIMSSEGSSLTGYYANKELRIIKIAVYQSRHQVILRLYPFGNDVAIVSEKIIYASDKPLSEITEDDYFLDKVFQAVIKDGLLYEYIDDREPMHLSDNTWYAEIYAKAVEALSEAGAGE